jgi:RNA polymerase sigma factor (sigma-70 family)
VELVKIIQRYDPERGRFATLAVRALRQALFSYAPSLQVVARPRTRNRALEPTMRRRSAFEASNCDLFLERITDPPTDPIFEETVRQQQRLRELLSRLRPDNYRVIELHCLQGLTYEEAAKTLRPSRTVSKQAVHQRFQKALLELTQVCREHNLEPDWSHL